MNNKRDQKFDDIFRMTKILIQPKHTIPTFGNFSIKYYFLASLDMRKTRLREGSISFEKPKIILTEKIGELFEGYGHDVEKFINEIYYELSQELRIIGYHFKHEAAQNKIMLEPFSAVLRKIREQSVDESRMAIITGVDTSFELSILKFTLEMINRSFPGNITELEEHGLFAAPEERELNRMKVEIEHLFRLAEKDPEALKLLGKTLKDCKLFSEYEDRFFGVVMRHKK
jgi:hypothetical protein